MPLSVIRRWMVLMQTTPSSRLASATILGRTVPSWLSLILVNRAAVRLRVSLSSPMRRCFRESQFIRFDLESAMFCQLPCSSG